jgi:hypothetical protein
MSKQEQELSKSVIESPVAGSVMTAFLSVAPKISMVSLVAYLTAVLAFHFFFNPNVLLDIVGACVLGLGSCIGLWTLFLSVHLSVEGKLFEVLYKNQKDAKAFDDAIKFMWKAHRKDRSLESRWKGTRTIFYKTITFCLLQWALTLTGFAMVVAGIQS